MKKKLLLASLLVCSLFLSACSDKQAEPTSSEVTLENVFDSYKQELKQTYSTSDQDFLLSDAAFRSSKLYSFCQDMPKGADLHVHNPTFLPLDKIADYVEAHEALKVLVTEGDTFGTIGYFADGSKITEGYMSMKEALAKGYTKSQFITAWSVKGNSGMRVWDWFENLFDKTLNITPTDKLKEDFLTEAFKYYISKGVTHIEPKVLFFGSETEALNQARAWYKAQNAARKVDPNFSVSIVFCGLKAKTDTYDKTQYNEMLFHNGVYVSKNIKDTIAGGSDFIVGLDLVNEEDASLPLVQFKSLIDNAVKENPSLHITLHAGESLKDDNNEIASAIALGAERIGHGFNLYKHDDVKQEIKNKGITLECCPISNHILGYCSDLQKHPAIQYIRDGVKVAICDDDPCFLMCGPLVDDYFVAAALWDLSLSEIKKTITDNIQASFLPDDRKAELLKAWQEKWDKFESEAISKFQK